MTADSEVMIIINKHALSKYTEPRDEISYWLKRLHNVRFAVRKCRFGL